VTGAASPRDVQREYRRLRILHGDNRVRVSMTTQAGLCACLRMDTFGDGGGLIAVAGAAIHGGGMFRMRVIFDGGMAIGAVQAPVNAGFLLRPVYIHTMACRVCQGRFAVTGEAFSAMLRTNCWSSKSDQNYGR